MSWRISKISNALHAVTLTNAKGEVLSLVIPEAHRASAALKIAYMKARTDAHDAEAAAKVIITEIEQKVIKTSTKHLWAIIGVEAAIIVLMLIHAKLG